MSALLLAVVLGPALATVAVAVLPVRARELGLATAVAAGLGWALVAAAEAPVEAADLVADPLVAAVGVGLCVLVAAAGSVTATGVCASLLVLTLVPGAAALDPARLPDRRLAAGILLAALLAAVRLLVERGPRLGQVVVVVAGLVLASGLVGDDTGEALALSAAGTLVAVVAVATFGAAGRLLVPAGLLAVARVATVRPSDPDLDVALLVVAATVAIGATILALTRTRPVVDRLPLGAALAAGGLLALDVADLRAAGALLAGGAVLALAAGHPVALVALAPGLAAAVHDAGLATEPEHVAVGAAALAALGAGLVGPLRSPGRRPAGPLAWAAAAFALVPLWGWSGAATDAYGAAAAVAVALGGLALAGAALAGAASAGGAGPAATAGRIVRRPRADPSHGSTPLEPPAEEAHREEAGAPPP